MNSRLAPVRISQVLIRIIVQVMELLCLSRTVPVAPSVEQVLFFRGQITILIRGPQVSEAPTTLLIRMLAEVYLILPQPMLCHRLHLIHSQKFVRVIRLLLSRVDRLPEGFTM